MIFRVVFLALMLIGAFYGLFWLLACTPFFKNKDRVIRIAKRVVLTLLAILATAMAMGFLTAVDYTF